MNCICIYVCVVYRYNMYTFMFGSMYMLEVYIVKLFEQKGFEQTKELLRTNENF